MPGSFPTVKDGDAITPRLFNIGFRELERWQKLTGDGQIHVSGAAGRTSPPRLSLALPDLIIPGKIGGSDIPALSGTTPGSGDIVLYDLDGDDLIDGPPETGWNIFTSALTSGKNAIFMRWAGKLWCIALDC